MATFIKHTTGLLDPKILTPSSSELLASPSQRPVDKIDRNDASAPQGSRVFSNNLMTEPPHTLDGSRSTPEVPTLPSESSNSCPPSSKSGFFSFRMKSVQATMSRSISERSLRRAESNFLHPQEGQHARSPHKLRRSASMIDTAGVRYAGEPSIYYDDEVGAVPRIAACARTIS